MFVSDEQALRQRRCKLYPSGRTAVPRRASAG